MTRVALPPVQAAAVRANFELVLVASPQGARLSLETGQRGLFGRPVRGGGQERAVQNLKAIQVMRLRREGLELRGAENTHAQVTHLTHTGMSESVQSSRLVPSTGLWTCWIQGPSWKHFPKKLEGLTALCGDLSVQCWQPLDKKTKGEFIFLRDVFRKEKG